MCEGHGTAPRESVYGGKDLSPGIAWQQGGEFVQRTDVDLSELPMNSRFDRIGLQHIFFHDRKENDEPLRIVPVRLSLNRE